MCALTLLFPWTYCFIRVMHRYPIGLSMLVSVFGNQWLRRCILRWIEESLIPMRMEAVVLTKSRGASTSKSFTWINIDTQGKSANQVLIDYLARRTYHQQFLLCLASYLGRLCCVLIRCDRLLQDNLRESYSDTIYLKRLWFGSCAVVK